MAKQWIPNGTNCFSLRETRRAATELSELEGVVYCFLIKPWLGGAIRYAVPRPRAGLLTGRGTGELYMADMDPKESEKQIETEETLSKRLGELSIHIEKGAILIYVLISV